MSFDNMMDKLVDVHWVKMKNNDGSYGVALQNSELYYDTTPDLTNVKCYYFLQTRTESRVIKQDVGYDSVAKYTFIFPIDTQIKLEDIIVAEGIKFRLLLPRFVRNHHIEVSGISVEVNFTGV